jgi:hypothetical protein
MSSVNPLWTKTPNARLLYKTLKPKKGELSKLLSNCINEFVQLEQVVMEETRYQWANGEIFIYFFEPPSSQAFDETPFWIGREVIGPPNEDPLERFGLHDLAQGRCAQRELTPYIFEAPDLSLLKDEYDALSQVVKERSSEILAKTWRIKLKNQGISTQAQIQLFPE